MVARVEGGLVGRLVLALEDVRDPRREAAERLVRRVDDVPASLDLALSDRIGLRVHRSSCSPFGSPGRSPEGDAPEAEPLCRGRRPVEGRSGTGECRPDRCLIHLAEADLQEDGHHPPDHPAQEGVGPDVDRHEPALPPDPDRMHGPDRRAVRRPEGAEVVPADEGRPGSRHRGGVERGPHPERRALVERTARPVPDGVAVLPVPRRIAGVERVRRRRTSRTATSVGRSASSARPRSVAVSRPA